jgi:hypothetical protein
MRQFCINRNNETHKKIIGTDQSSVYPLEHKELANIFNKVHSFLIHKSFQSWWKDICFLSVQYLQETKKPEEEKTSFSQTLANIPRDVGLNVAQGAVSGFRMIADAFGADSDTSKNLRGVEGYLGDLMSAQAKNNKKEISRIMQEAEKQGTYEQVVAGLKSLAVAPVDTLSNAFGTMATVIVGSLAAEIIGPTFAVASGLGVGGAMGAGTVKGAIYDSVKEAFLKANPNDPATAEARAVKDPHRRADGHERGRRVAVRDAHFDRELPLHRATCRGAESAIPLSLHEQWP